jgi:fused signal recognition particle receptor
MFKFLKDKLKDALTSFSEKAEEEAEEQIEEQVEEVQPEESVSEPEVVEAEKTTPELVEEKSEDRENEEVIVDEEQKEVVGKADEVVVEEEPEVVVQETAEETLEEPELVEEETEIISEEPLQVEQPEEIIVEEQKPEAEVVIEDQPVEFVQEEKPEEVPSAEELVDEEVEIPTITIPEEKKGFFKKLKEKFSGEEEKVEEEPEPMYPELTEDGDEIKVEAEGVADEIVFEEPELEVEGEESLQTLKKETEEDSEADEIAKRLQAAIESEDEEETAEEKIEVVEERSEEPKKKGVFAKLKEAITTKKLSSAKFDDLFWELEVVLLENNVAVEVIEKIKHDLSESLVDKPIQRGKMEEEVLTSLKNSITQLFDVESFDLLDESNKKKPYVICFVGINGSGKTTTIAKVAQLFKDAGKGVVLAAADTFRAAAIDQLQEHADKLDIKMIKHDYGSDPAAVAFDAIKHAKDKDKDVVLIDTAGRLHSNVNLMDEMKKIMRVAEPDVKIFIGESITGNDCTEQAKKFNEAIGIDGIVLSKADIDEKGGAAISVSYVTKKPILYLGTGQEYADLEKFDAQKLLSSLGL